MMGIRVAEPASGVGDGKQMAGAGADLETRDGDINRLADETVHGGA